MFLFNNRKIFVNQNNKIVTEKKQKPLKIKIHCI